MAVSLHKYADKEVWQRLRLHWHARLGVLDDAASLIELFKKALDLLPIRQGKIKKLFDEKVLTTKSF